MTQPKATDESVDKTLMRSGMAARLADLSPSTLRIWEHRYGVVAPPKTASGQRTYSMDDVERLRVVKRLTLEGYAIGTIAHLDTEALVNLLAGNRVPPTSPQRVLLVGETIARKLKGRLSPEPTDVFDDLGCAEGGVALTGRADVLVVHVPTLHASMTERLTRLRHALPVAHVIVVYSFGTKAVAEALRVTGVAVRREPISGKELAQLITDALPTPAPIVSAARTANRHFSDTELVALTEIPSMLDCECPRHLAEIVTLLVGFELYSAECAARSQGDAALHRHLCEVTGAARTMLEQALARLVIGVELNP